MSPLTAAQINEVLAPSKRYPAADYDAVIAKLKKGKKVNGLSNIETQFPGVKPAHVAHMLKKLKGDDETLVVDTHALHGVCLIRRTTPADETA